MVTSRTEGIKIAKPDAKYVWSITEFDIWIKNQKKHAKRNGISVSSVGVTKALMDRVIRPNEIKLFPKPKKIKIKKF